MGTPCSSSPQPPTMSNAAEAATEYDHLMKLCIVGDSGVGKSCLISQYCEAFFPLVSDATCRVDFRVKLRENGNKLYKVQLWDTAGQERFRSLTASYYKMADGIVFAYDLNDPASVEALETRWLPEARRHHAQCLESGNVLILGTKSDLVPPGDLHTAAA